MERGIELYDREQHRLRRFSTAGTIRAPVAAITSVALAARLRIGLLGPRRCGRAGVVRLAEA